MRKIELVEEELLIVKQALCDMKENLDKPDHMFLRSDLETINGILVKIKQELNKQELNG